MRGREEAWPLLLVEVRERRHTAFRRHVIDDLRKRRRELAQEFLLAHAGAGGEVVQHVLAERAAELAGLDRLIVAMTDPRIDLRARAAGREFADEVGEAAEDVARGGVGRNGGHGRRRGRRAWSRRRAAAEHLAQDQGPERHRDRCREIAAGYGVLHCVVERSHGWSLLWINSR